MLVLVVNLKTRAIIGYIFDSDCKNEDLIIEFYQKILEQYDRRQKPIFIHFDLEPAFISDKVCNFLKENNIDISSTILL